MAAATGPSRRRTAPEGTTRSSSGIRSPPGSGLWPDALFRKTSAPEQPCRVGVAARRFHGAERPSRPARAASPPPAAVDPCTQETPEAPFVRRTLVPVGHFVPTGSFTRGRADPRQAGAAGCPPADSGLRGRALAPFPASAMRARSNAAPRIAGPLSAGPPPRSWTTPCRSRKKGRAPRGTRPFPSRGRRGEPRRHDIRQCASAQILRFSA